MGKSNSEKATLEIKKRSMKIREGLTTIKLEEKLKN